MKTAPPCRICGKPVADAYCCSPCWSRLERNLGDVTFLSVELQTTVTRQSRTGGNSAGSRSTETPVFFNDGVADVATCFRQILVSWSLLIVEERGLLSPRDDLAAVGTFLLANVEWLRHHPAADDAYRELNEVIGQARNAIDRPPSRLYAGPCDPSGQFHLESEGWATELLGPCRTDLYATAGKVLVTCPRCQLPWYVKERREYLLESAHGELATASTLSLFLTAYGEPLTADRIWKWAERGQIVAHGHDKHSRPLYKVSEAIEVLARLNQPRKKLAS